MIRTAPRALPVRRLVSVLACASLLGLLAPPVSAQPTPPPDERFERIAAAVSESMTRLGVPGAALGISFEGRRWTRGFGVTSVENPLPVNEETLFQAGSITKTMTGMVALRLVEVGKLKLDAPIRDLLPTFRVRDETASQRATLRTLLTHTAGWEGDLFDDPGNGDDALARMVEKMADLEQVAPFESFWSYNNAGFYLAGRTIEIVTGKTYEAALRELLLAPLGLRQTFLDPAEVMTYRFAVGHAGSSTRQIVLRPWPVPRGMNPAGGAVMSVGDLLTYGEFQLGDGVVVGGERVLSPESMRRLHETQLPKQGSEGEMAFAWQVSRLGGPEGPREIWHDGAAVGQQALLSVVPERRMVLALLTNSIRGEALNREIARLAAREYLGLTLADPVPRKVPAADLAQYAGRYTRPFLDVVVTVEGSELRIQTIQKQGFPTPKSFVPPAAPAAPYGLYAKDRLIGLGPVQGTGAEFLRGPDGTVGWIRINGRVARRLP
jgi:CubicO group peptidase (beta-lactamase class C family)